MPVLPTYKNHSIDLHSKSIDWFLCEGNIGIWCLTKAVLWTFYLKMKSSVLKFYKEFPLFSKNLKCLTAKPNINIDLRCLKIKLNSFFF